MTILRPHIHHNFTKFLAVFFAAVLLGGLVYVYEYNALVDARAEASRFSRQIAKGQTEVATLKNDLYRMLDPVTLHALAKEEGFTLEKYPRYVTVRELP